MNRKIAEAYEELAEALDAVEDGTELGVALKLVTVALAEFARRMSEIYYETL